MPELISDPNNIKINEQQEIQQIMGDPPSWIVRWGISLVFIAVATLFVIAYMVKYPEVVSAPIVLQTENPPIRVPTRTNGKLEQLFVNNKEAVKKEQILAIIESTAQLESIEELQGFVKQIENEGLNSDLKLPIDLKLGTLQNTWSLFSEGYQKWTYFLTKDKSSKKVRLLKRQISDTKDLNGVLTKRQGSLRENRRILQDQYNRNQKLYGEGLVSINELENIKAELIAINRQIDDVESEVINNNIVIRQLNRQILDLGEDKERAANEKNVELEEHFKKVKTELSNWEANYVLKSPIDGVVSFSNPLTEGETVQTGAEIMTVLPEGKKGGEIIGLAALPFDGSGKVKLGQQVNIQLKDYPYQQYGTVQGEVHSIALLPKEDGYQVEIKMPNTLITSYKKTLPFRQKMTGYAKIITAKRRYLERLFDKLRSTKHNNL